MKSLVNQTSPQDILNFKIPSGRVNAFASNSVSSLSFSWECGARLTLGGGGQVTPIGQLQKSPLLRNKTHLVLEEACPAGAEDHLRCRTHITGRHSFGTWHPVDQKQVHSLSPGFSRCCPLLSLITHGWLLGQRPPGIPSTPVFCL